MKKSIAFLLVLTLVFSLSACSNPAEKTDAPKETTQTKQQETTVAQTTTVATVAETTQAETTSEKTVEVPHSDKFKVEDGKVVFKDHLDRDVAIKQKPERVVAISYNALDLWYAAGGVGVLRNEHPLIHSRKNDEITEKIKQLPVMNGANDPVNIEVLLNNEPDLVIITPGPRAKNAMDIIPVLEENNIPYFGYKYEDFEGFLEAYELFCLINNRMDLYEEVAKDNIMRVNAVKEKIKDTEPITMVMLIPSAKMGTIALANIGYLGNLCEEMNTVNVAFKDQEVPAQGGGVISMEKLIELDPQFILSRGGSGDGSKENALNIFGKSPLWQELSAIKNGNYDHLPAELFLYEANTRYAEAYEYLAKLLYPELFE